MDKDKIRAFCEGLIESYKTSEAMVNHDRGTYEDEVALEKEIESLKIELNELLK
ncbi:hypothetical protein NST07_20610 [Paenibacillus sp. FSL L8-0340]|uniref:hypothetical protein n=1 Tax=Paenibacillus sp. FSL L8-0340 TaxID=2954685 RepID=UPI0031586109